MTSQWLPGRELDALIAEKVMGCTALVREEWNWKRTGADIDQGSGINYSCRCPFFHGSKDTGIKPYSSDISAAWEVFEKIAKELLFVEIFYNNRRWQVTFDRDIWTVNSDISASHAICLAALKTIHLCIQRRDL